MISYSPSRIDRRVIECALRVAQRVVGDHVGRHTRTIRVDHDRLEEAAALLESFFPERFHRVINERDIACVAVALAIGRDVTNAFLNHLADELNYFPDTSVDTSVH